MTAEEQTPSLSAKGAGRLHRVRPGSQDRAQDLDHLPVAFDTRPSLR